MHPALKQRIVGAIVLVATGVLVIPLILDGPDHDPHLRKVPAVPPDFETRLLPLDPELEVPGSESLAPVVDLPEPARIELTTPSVAEEVPTVAELVTKPKHSTTPPRGEWVLQLGSFGQARNAENLVERLKADGLQAWSEPVPSATQTLHRVRAGYWSTRELALDAGEQIAAAYPDLDISPRRLDAEAREVEEVRSVDVGWIVQMGSFAQAANASELRDRLRRLGYAAHSEVRRVEGGERHRVWVGPELSREDALAVRDRLREAVGVNGLVVSHP